MRKNKDKERILNIPSFRNDHVEAGWWDYNKNKVEELMLNAFNAGKLQRGTAFKLAGKASRAN